MRKDYYNYEKSTDTQPFESKSKFNHDGEVIHVDNMDSLEELAKDYICTKRAGTYFEAFEMVLKVVDVLRKQSRALDELNSNYTI